MAAPVYNLVIIEGAKKDFDEFQKIAFKNKKEAFCLDQLLPEPDSLDKERGMSDKVEASTPNECVSTGGLFGTFIEKSNSSLKYFFHTNHYKAPLEQLATKYSHLKFTHVYVEVWKEKCGINKYEKGEKIFDCRVDTKMIDWHIASQVNTYLYLEDWFHKFTLLMNTKPNVFNKLFSSSNSPQYSFFKIFNQFNYLRDHEEFYDSLYCTERELEKRDLEDVSEGITCPYSTNSILSQLKFIDQNFLPSEKKTNRTINILHQMGSNAALEEHEKLTAFIYIHQRMDMEEWLIPIVSAFIHDSIDKMKSYLRQRDPLSKIKVDLQSYVVLTLPLRHPLKEIEFMDWPGLEKDQALYHEWLAKALAVKKTLEPMQSETEDEA